MLPESIPKFLKTDQEKCQKRVYFGAEWGKGCAETR